jgi:1-piperideine-2-carboxylate/1-pyrroline-2-carboxylate reductase [NAD(P)H]
VSLLLDAPATAHRLPYPALVAQVRAVLADATVRVPQRLVQALPGGGSLFVMPAFDAHIAITKLITFTPANAGRAARRSRATSSCSTWPRASGAWCSTVRP